MGLPAPAHGDCTLKPYLSSFIWYLIIGIQYLRDYLHLPMEIVPSTLKRQAPKEARPARTAAPRYRYGFFIYYSFRLFDMRYTELLLASAGQVGSFIFFDWWNFIRNQTENNTLYLLQIIENVQVLRVLIHMLLKVLIWSDRILGLFVEWGKLNVLKCEKTLKKCA